MLDPSKIKVKKKIHQKKNQKFQIGLGKKLRLDRICVAWIEKSAFW